MIVTAKHLTVALGHVIHRYFIWVIVASYAVAAVWPGFGLWIRDMDVSRYLVPRSGVHLFLPPIMLAVLLFNAGLGVRLEELSSTLAKVELRGLLHRSFMVWGGLLANFAVPLAFILAVSYLMEFWYSTRELQQILVGLALVASMPIAGASTAYAQNANGNLALSLGLVLLTTVLSPLTTPLTLHAAGFMTTGDYSEDLHRLASSDVASFLAGWVLLPSLLGIAANQFIGEGCIALVTPYLKLTNCLVLVLLNYSNAALTLPKVALHPDPYFILVILLIVTALCTAGFISGFLLARFARADRQEMASLMFGLGMNNNGTGLVLASMELPRHPTIMLPVIAYSLVQYLLASSVDFVLFSETFGGNREI